MNIEFAHNGDYYIPNLQLSDERLPIGKWARMHREYLKEYHPIRYHTLTIKQKRRVDNHFGMSTHLVF